MFNLAKVFGMSNHEWEAEKRNVVAFGDKIRNLGEPESAKDIFEYLIDFFNICSEFQDNGMIHHCPDYETMCAFNRTLKNCGRDKYGWNRTEKGQRVTLDNVYLGDVFGLFTHTARTWRQSDDVYEGFHKEWTGRKNQEDPSMREVIGRYQVLPFVSRNRKTILETVRLMSK